LPNAAFEPDIFVDRSQQPSRRERHSTAGRHKWPEVTHFRLSTVFQTVALAWFGIVFIYLFRPHSPLATQIATDKAL
jgi:hypothetical protein